MAAIFNNFVIIRMEVVILAGKYVLFQKIDLMCDIILELKWIFVIWT